MSSSPQTNNSKSLSKAGLLILAILQTLMLAALYTRTMPHPPLSVTPFAMAPFISMSIALAAAAIYLDHGRPMKFIATAACLSALLSYGPQKWFDPAFGQIWPAVILAQFAVATILYDLYFGFAKGER